MSCPVIHTMKSEFNIAEALVERGLWGSRKVFQYNRDYVPEGRQCGNVLDMSGIDEKIIYQNVKENYEVRVMYNGLDEQQEKIRSYSEKGFSVKNIEETSAEHRHGWITFEKPWDKDVYDSLKYAFVTPQEDGSIRWVRNYYSDDLPLVAISKYFPDVEFEYKERGECTEDGASIYAHEIIKDGTCVKCLLHEAQFA